MKNCIPPLPHCGNPGPHILTGPVQVRGAKPGDVLRVDVLSANGLKVQVKHLAKILRDLGDFDTPRNVVLEDQVVQFGHSEWLG